MHCGAQPCTSTFSADVKILGTNKRISVQDESGTGSIVHRCRSLDLILGTRLLLEWVDETSDFFDLQIEKAPPLSRNESRLMSI